MVKSVKHKTRKCSFISAIYDFSLICSFLMLLLLPTAQQLRRLVKTFHIGTYVPKFIMMLSYSYLYGSYFNIHCASNRGTIKIRYSKHCNTNDEDWNISIIDHWNTLPEFKFCWMKIQHPLTELKLNMIFIVFSGSTQHLVFFCVCY